MIFLLLLVSMKFNPDENDKYYKKINLDYFGLRTNLLIMKL